MSCETIIFLIAMGFGWYLHIEHRKTMTDEEKNLKARQKARLEEAAVKGGAGLFFGLIRKFGRF